jgi:proton-dependent oligopeptide transporter, POT family
MITQTEKSFGLALKHPRGLYFLFLTEMWERFSYYGMRALLVFYMIKHLLFDQAYASHIYGLYTGFVYFTPLFGGLLADRLLGRHRVVIIGAILMATGHFLMASESVFFLALLFLVLGNGAFKPNISAQIGDLYPLGDSRRDSAFSIFYLGSNLGAVFSALVCGTLGETYGWHYGFGTAGVGMLLGLGIYLAGQKHLNTVSCPIRRSSGMNPGNVSDKKMPGTYSKVIGLLSITFFSMFFFAAYEQQGNTMALWADSYTDRHIFGWEMPATWYQSLNPFLLIILMPIVISLWRWQTKRNCEPSNITKMIIGCIFLGSSFLIMIPAVQSTLPYGERASFLLLVANAFLLTIGELYFSPASLSLVTKVAPIKMVSTMMGAYFLSFFGGNYLGGFLGVFWEIIPKDKFFLMLSLSAFVGGLGLFSVQKVLFSTLNLLPTQYRSPVEDPPECI